MFVVTVVELFVFVAAVVRVVDVFIWFCLLLFAFRFEVLHFVVSEMCFEECFLLCCVCLFCCILGSGPIGPPPPGVFIIVVVVVVFGLCCGCGFFTDVLLTSA